MDRVKGNFGLRRMAEGRRPLSRGLRAHHNLAMFKSNYIGRPWDCHELLMDPCRRTIGDDRDFNRVQQPKADPFIRRIRGHSGQSDLRKAAKPRQIQPNGSLAVEDLDGHGEIFNPERNEKSQLYQKPAGEIQAAVIGGRFAVLAAGGVGVSRFSFSPVLRSLG